MPLTQSKYLNLIWSVLRILMILAVITVIFNQIETVSAEWISNRIQWNNLNWGMFILAALGLILNIGTEVIKWKMMTSAVQKLTFKKLVQSILTGITLSIITPQRIGDVAGRMVHFSKQGYPELLAIQVLGGMIQIAMTLLVGLVSLLLLNREYDWMDINLFTSGIILLFCLALLLLHILIFVPAWVVKLTQKIPLKGRLKDYVSRIQILTSFRVVVILKLYGFTFLRYLIYTTQLLLLIEFLGQPALDWINLGAVFLLFFIQTGVPLPPLFSLVVRGTIALQVWSLIGLPGFKPLIASYLLWLLNLGLPAVVGTFILIRIQKNSHAQ